MIECCVMSCQCQVRASCTTKKVEVVAVRSSDAKLKARSATFSFNSLEMDWNKKEQVQKMG